MKLPLNQKLSYSQAGVISPRGIDEIDNYLLKKYGRGYRPTNKLLVDPKTGKLPKRAANTFKKQHQISLTPEDLTEIGNLAAKYSISTIVDYDFTRDFNWKAGDFGDHGSCYWGGNSLARTALHQAGAYAMRIYRPMNHPDAGKGIGRMWIVPIREMGTDCYILYNAYGNPNGLTSAHFVQIFTDYMNANNPEVEWDYKAINLTNQGSKTGLVWINHINANSLYDGRNFVVGPEKVVKHLDYFDLDLDTDDLEDMYEEYELCDFCERRLTYRDSSYHVEDHLMCRNCYLDRAGRCDGCGSYHMLDDLNQAIGRMRQVIMMCHNCVHQYAFQCDGCELFYRHEYHSAIGDLNHSFCAECARNRVRCFDCQQLTVRDECLIIDHAPYCENCSLQHRQCDRCGIHLDTRLTEPYYFNSSHSAILVMQNNLIEK